MIPLNKMLMRLALITLFIKSGMTLKCFNCDSTNNPGCDDLKAGSGLNAEVCTPSILAHVTNNNWVKELTKIDFHNSNTAITVPMVCQKIIATNENGEKTTYRGCQLDGGKTDLCTVTISKAKEQKRVIIDHCSICDKDLCNGVEALKTQTYKSLVLLIGAFLLGRFMF